MMKRSGSVSTDFAPPELLMLQRLSSASITVFYIDAGVNELE